MPRASLPTGIEVEYETYGDFDDPALLLVNGYGSQMLSWNLDLVDQFVRQGLFVIRFDNRDAGLSTKLDGQAAQPMKVLEAVLASEPRPEVPYTLSDMAADGIALLEHLGLEKAHLAGVSMGGMIVQTMAIEYPDRVATLTSIMSSPGDPLVGRPTPEARAALLAAPQTGRQAYIDQAVDAKVWASRRYYDEHAVRDLAAAAYDRCFYPEGGPRQLAALYASGDRSAELAKLDVPTLVIHGRDDTLITPEGGERTAELVPGARYLYLSDMGHDLPRPLYPVFAEAIGGFIRSAAAMAAA